MPSETANELIHYHSLFRHGVDEKRRVQVPAKWRPTKPGVEFTLLLWPNGAQADACLLVLPPPEMRALAEKIKAMSFADPKASALRRLLGSKSASVALDKGGRICVPEAMAKAVNIESDRVTAAIARFIWILRGESGHLYWPSN